MSDNTQPEALRLAGLLELAPEDGVEPQTTEDAAAELRRQHTRIAELEARIKTMAEEHADELMVAHLDGRMRAAQPAGAQQPDTAYAELPSYEHQRAIMEAERNASLDEYSRIVPLTSTESMIYERAFTNGWNRHASHGQAPAQAAPAYKDSTPELHVGDSAFESWYSTYSPAHKADKQRARDAYAAGMGDPLVMAAPAAVAGAIEAVKFTDQSTADPVEKARRYLTAMGDQRTNSAYFYDDGYPRRESAQDALATLAVLEQLAAPPHTQPAPAGFFLESV